MSDTTILRVAVPAPLRALFDYLPPAGCDPDRLRPGIRLLVPFGRGERCGVLVAVAGESGLERSKLKAALAFLDPEPLLSERDLKLLHWAARYYQYPLGEVIHSALPVRLRQGKTDTSLRRPGWRLTPLGTSRRDEDLKRAPRQAEIIGLLRPREEGMTTGEIRLHCGACSSVLRGMEKKGWLEPCELELVPAMPIHTVAQERRVLNPEQRAATEVVSARLHEFGAFLLDGVTGSGKTEVYLGLIERVIGAGSQVLILVPEIGLTPQLLQRFQRRITAPMALLHSGLSETERERGWQEARQGKARLVLGTRSAVFTPLPDLGLILVDEEHDLSFKQQEGFRYSARDLAVVRAQLCHCPVLLGSATPSLESFRNGREGRYHLLQLKQRAGGAVPPRLDLLDVRSVRLESGVSPTLRRMIKEELSAGNQVLLFLNRRGYAPILSCYDCGWIAQCQRCDARMTLHLEKQLLWCHHCGSQRRLERVCPDCGGCELKPLGQGTERLEETLRKLFPEQRVARIDRDSTRRRGSLERLLREIRKGKYSLLLGTQMLAKGHHFPDVTLVGVLDVDQGLFGADYRAAERMAQLIIQVAGRAGRAEKPGRVVIQTRYPDHPLLQTLLRMGYGEFARASLRERREALLPPYSHQALLRAESHREADPVEFLDQASRLATEMAGPDIELWGPVPAPMERRAGRYRAHLLLQSGQRAPLQALLSRWILEIQSLKSARRVRWSIDVDPQEML